MIRSEQLANGVEISFRDETRRYFGDYHRVCVIASIRYALAGLAEDVFPQQAMAACGAEIRVEKRFERMGVPSAAVDTVRRALVDGFMQHAGGYMSRPDYPRQLVAAELNRKRPGRPYV